MRGWRAGVLNSGGLLLLAVLTAIGGCVAPPSVGDSVDKPVETTVQAIAADPARYHHKFVRVRGVVDRCMTRGGSCGLEQANPGELPTGDNVPAISVRFGEQFASPTTDASLDGGVSRVMNALYRFSDVTVVGRYDASCEAGRDLDRPLKPGMPEEIVVCFDGYGTGLAVERVLAVHKRWPATAFPSGSDLGDVLAAAPPATAEKVLTAYIDALLAVDPVTEIDDLVAGNRVFLLAEFPDTAKLCFCRRKQCSGQWPSSTAQLIPALANPYYCIDAERTNGVWRFPPARE